MCIFWNLLRGFQYQQKILQKNVPTMNAIIATIERRTGKSNQFISNNKSHSKSIHDLLTILDTVSIAISMKPRQLLPCGAYCSPL